MRPMYNALRTGLIGILGATILLAWNEVGEFEGKHWPVAKAYSILNEEPATNLEGTYVSFVFYKDRACKFKLQEMYIPSSKGWSWVPWFDPKRKRGQGVYTRPSDSWFQETWLVGYPAKSVGTPIKIVLHHECWGSSFWETVTEITIPERKQTERK